jgi:hypothetical protein
MKQLLYIILILPFLLLGCGKTNNLTDKIKSKMKLTFEVIPEDYERNLSYIEWNDTLGQNEGYGGKWIKRPKEIWCVITNVKKDTLGYYRGLSTAQTFADFQSKDTLVTLNFMAGLNFFSDKFENEKEAIDYSKKNNLPIVYEPIQINIKTDLRKKFEIELNEK